MTVTTLPPIRDTPLPVASEYEAGRLSHARSRALFWLTLAFWGSNFLLLTLGTALSGNEHLSAIAGMRVLTTLFGLGLCYLIHLLLRHPRLSTTKRRLITLACVAPVAAETYAWAAFFAQAAVDPSLNLRNFTWFGAINTIAFWTWFFLAWAGLYLALSYSFDVQEERQRSAELKEQTHVAQLRALHSQINPHFLFNSLNSVSALILDGKTEMAEDMVTKLARFLRLGLAADPTRKIPLSLEIELQHAYLEIEQLRYPDLEFAVDVPEELNCALVPALILQPIVENAVKYGVAGTLPPSNIRVRASSNDACLILEVTDSGKKSAKASPEGGGIGLKNVRQRLGLMYGEHRSELTSGRIADGSFRTQLSLPLELS
jgi:two-component system LytT family sensor kinase